MEGGPSSGQTSTTSEPKGKEKEINVKEKRSHLERRLDKLAWLMEGNSKCTAVCIMDGKFYIASNEIAEKTKPKNKQTRQIIEIMKYFKEVENQTTSPEERKLKRDALMNSIFQATQANNSSKISQKNK